MSEVLRLADLLAEPLLRSARVVAGTEGLDRTVTDVRWFVGSFDELTGSLLVCSDARVSPPYRLDALVRRAEEAEAAGLLVVSQAARPLLSSLRLANRLRLPVLWLTDTEPVRLVQELTPRVRAPEQVRARILEKLLRRLSAKRTGAELLVAAESVLSVELSLITADGLPLLGRPVDALGELKLVDPVPQRDEHRVAHPVLDPEASRLAAWLVATVPSTTGDRAHLLELALALTEPFIRAWLAVQRAQSDRDTVFESQLLSEIVSAGDSLSRDVAEATVSLGWRLQGWHVGLHVLTEAPRPLGHRDPRIDQLCRELDQRGVTVVTAVNRSDGWALWTSSDTQPGANAARQLLRAVRVAAAATPEEWRLSIGIGRARRGPSGLTESLNEARDAADLGRSHEFRPAVEHSDELGVARLLATWQRSDVTRAFAETALSPLRETPQLLETLTAFLESGGSMVETAQVLRVHRNTVTHRMQQLRERLGVDLDDPSQRLALQVACRSLNN